jgi:flagellar motility protein MotE (MotC chaperone)
MGNYDQFFRAARAVKQDAPVTRRNKKRRRPTKASFPLLPVFAVTVALAGAVWASLNVEKIEKLVSVVDIRMFGRAHAETQTKGGAKTDVQASSKGENAAQAEVHKATAKEAGSKNWTPEQLAVFNKLEERKSVLDAKEIELTKLEEELQKQRSELEEKVKQLEKLRAKIAEKLAERVGVDQERVAKLVEIYSNMKPQNAAKVFEDIDEDLAVEVLGKMKKKNMAEILNLLKPEKAQRLSERFAGYKAQ